MRNKIFWWAFVFQRSWLVILKRCWHGITKTLSKTICFSSLQKVQPYPIYILVFCAIFELLNLSAAFSTNCTCLTFLTKKYFSLLVWFYKYAKSQSQQVSAFSIFINAFKAILKEQNSGHKKLGDEMECNNLIRKGSNVSLFEAFHCSCLGLDLPVCPPMDIPLLRVLVKLMC